MLPIITYVGTQYTNHLRKTKTRQINRLAAMMLTPTRKNVPTAALKIRHGLIPLELALQETALNAYHRLKLMQINRLAAMMLTPTRKNAPTAALEIIYDLISLELALTETALNAYHRLKLMTQASWTNNKVKNHSLLPHLKFLKTTDAQATGLRQDTETIIESIKDKNYWITINNKKGKTKPIPSPLNVYTDGRKTNQGAGSGYVILCGKDRVLNTQSINLTGEASIFQAELIAIQEAESICVHTRIPRDYT